jgi:hypothetical protein
MAKGDVHTVPQGDQWTNEVEGQDGSSGQHSTKEEAVKAGREMAKANKSEHLIHNQDGTIHERNSYGHDPRDVPG